MNDRILVPGRPPAGAATVPAVAVNVNGQVMNLPAVAVVALETGLQSALVAEITSSVTAAVMAEFQRQGLIAYPPATPASQGDEPTDG